MIPSQFAGRSALKLPPPSIAVNHPNVQLPDLLDSVVSGVTVTGHERVCQPLYLVPTRPSGVKSSVRLDAGVKQTDLVEVSVGGGDNAEIQRFNGQCHEECYAGLGGEMVCVHDDLGGYGEADVSGVHPSHAESLG